MCFQVLMILMFPPSSYPYFHLRFQRFEAHSESHQNPRFQKASTEVRRLSSSSRFHSQKLIQWASSNVANLRLSFTISALIQLIRLLRVLRASPPKQSSDDYWFTARPRNLWLPIHKPSGPGTLVALPWAGESPFPPVLWVCLCVGFALRAST